MRALYAAAEKHSEHKYVFELAILVFADVLVRLLVEPEHVKHGVTMIVGSIFGQQ
jgi:hypothetical protein